ncbi:MAG: hypothetical protein KJN67_01210 [Pontiella sp.]|nr:hypothetical protein [Pontiella sp.]MBT8045760.1 hypothetical protein [Pontiella sp.]NNJ71021.1 hypothetical protein [Kiritimatiellales bacterium]
MVEKKPSPLQTAFWLTDQEKRYILVICALLFIGLATRYFYLKNEKSEVFVPSGVEQASKNHE